MTEMLLEQDRLHRVSNGKEEEEGEEEEEEEVQERAAGNRNTRPTRGEEDRFQIRPGSKAQSFKGKGAAGEVPGQVSQNIIQIFFASQIVTRAVPRRRWGMCRRRDGRPARRLRTSIGCGSR